MPLPAGLRRAWESPTLTTWASFLAKSLNLVVILPLVLGRFTEGDILAWQILTAIAGLQILVDLGFAATLGRLIAYAMAGARDLHNVQGTPAAAGSAAAAPNTPLLRQIYATMSALYARLGVAFTLLFGIIGTAVLWKPSHGASSSTDLWLAWATVLAATSLNVWGSTFVAYLMGTNHVALLRRWEAVTALLGLVTGLGVILSGGRLLALTLATQAWVVVNILRNRWLVRVPLQGLMRQPPAPCMDREILRVSWPATWRSAIGIVTTYGVVQATGLLAAQFAPVDQASAYLLAMRMMQFISGFSTAPFYSKLPVLGSLYASGEREQLVRLAGQGMRFSHWSFAAALVGVSLLGPTLLVWVHSRVPFPAGNIWAPLALAYFVERYGAMHLQLYSVTNHIIWHIANGGTGLLIVAAAAALVPSLGVAGLALAVLIGQAGCYAWYPTVHSCRKFALRWASFESRIALGPFLLVSACAAASFRR